MLVWKVIALLVGGFAVGALDAVVGGGSLLMVSLLSFLGTPTMSTIATMRLATVFQELTGSITYAKQKLVTWKQTLILAGFAMMGSFIGANLVLQVNRDLLSKIVGGIMVFLLFLLPRTDTEKKVNFLKRIWDKYFNGGILITHNEKRLMFLSFLTFLLGIYGGFYGGSIGTMLLMLFLLLGESPLLVSAASVKIITLVLSISASYVFLKNGRSLIDWQLLFPLVWSTSLGSYIGVKKATKIPTKYLKITLYIVVAASAIKLIFFANL